MNPYVYNPAYAGVEGHTVLFLMYRQQWTNIEGAPETMHASFHVPLDGGIALGASAFNVTQGLLTTSAGKVSAGYLVNIDRTHFLRFGLSIGGGMNSVNITEFDSPDDVAFNNFLDQNSFLIGDFGMTYHFDHFNVGFSIPNLFTYDVVTQTEFSPVNVTPLDNVLFKMNYRGHLNDDFAFEPHLIYRYSQVVPHQFEGTLIAHVKHIVWVGASYRQDAGIIGLMGAKVKEKIGIGFAYELGNPNISSELGPTFEFNIGYHLGTKKDHAEHVSSFIKSHRLSAEERARKAELERQRQIAALQNSRQNQTPSGNEDALGIVGTPTKPPLSGSPGDTSGSTDNPSDLNNTGNPDDPNDTGNSGNPIGSNNTETPDSPSSDNQGNTTNPSGSNDLGNQNTGNPNVGLTGSPGTPGTPNNAGANTTGDTPNNWNHDEDAGRLERTNQFGENEVGFRLEKPNSTGGKDVVLSWMPASQAENVQISSDGHLERELDDGTKEIGVKYERVNADGSKEQIIKWDRIISPQQAERISNNPTLTEAQHNEIEKADPQLTQDFRTHDELAVSADHITVRRGNHMLELPAGNYVVAGAFEEFSHAEDYSDDLFQQGFHDARNGFSSARGYYYVIVYQSANVDQARSRRDEFRKLTELSKAWVLQVTE